MICEKCNYENLPEAEVCQNCGAPLNAGEKICKKCNHMNSAEAEFCEKCGKTLKEKKSKKKLWISLVAILVVVAIVGISFFVFDYSGEAEKQLELGYQYLSEGNYEEAILAFDKAIEIDSKNVDAYIGKAKAQAKIIDENTVQNVVDILEKGYNETENEKIFDTLCEISESLTNDGQGELAFKVLRLGYEKFKDEKTAEYLYAKADSLWNEKKLGEATKIFMTICDYKDSRQRVLEWNKRLSSNTLSILGLKTNGEVVAWPYGIGDTLNGCIAVSAGNEYDMGVKPDGTVIVCDRTGAVSSEKVKDIQHKVDLWGEVESVHMGASYAVGLKSNGKISWIEIPQDFGEETFGEEYVEPYKKFYQEVNSGVQKATAEWSGITEVYAGLFGVVGLKSDGTVVAEGRNEGGQCNVFDWADIVAVSAGNAHTVGLKSDGTVVAVGDNENGQCNVTGWKDIVMISAGYGYTVGLKSDGTVVAVGDNGDGNCDVSGWKDIVAVSAGGNTVGLKSDGTVVVASPSGFLDNSYQLGYCDNVMSVDIGARHSVAVSKDGTVVAEGRNEDGQCDVSDWVDIVAVSAGNAHTVGLKSDGTVVAVGNNDDGQCNVSEWSEITAVCCGERHTVGLKSDGTVVVVGADASEIEKWNNIKAISASYGNTYGLKLDGTVVSTENSERYEEWKNIVAISRHTTRVSGRIVGLKSDGTIVGAENWFYEKQNADAWNDVVQIIADPWCVVGLKSDGSVIAVGDNQFGECDVEDWENIVGICTWVQSTIGIKKDGTIVGTGYNADCFKWKLF